MTRLRLVVFALIGLIAAQQWSALLTAPPTARLLGVVAIATLLALLLSRLRPRPLATAAAAAGATVGALLIVGIPLADLVPWGWGGLAADVDRGLHGLGGAFVYPFERPDEWARLLLVVAIVPLTIGAAVLSFRPGRKPDRAPVAGLVLLTAAVAIPATVRPTAAPLLWGAALIALIALWLWGGRMRAATALALVGAVTLAAVPLASGVASGDPRIDYESWALPKVVSGISFDWEASSGPIAWPQTGRVMFRVHSERRSYWRADILNSFDSDAWRRSRRGGPQLPGEPGPMPAPTTDPNRTRSGWFMIRGLESSLLISPGTPLAFEGVDGGHRDRDGTTHFSGEPLRRGDSYSVSAWTPEPPAAKLRKASRRYRRVVRPYTRLALPAGGDRAAIRSPEPIAVPPFGERRGAARARRRLAATAYGRVARLAERLTADAGSGYGAARAISVYLRGTYRYDEQPPRRPLPLRAFLFRDRAGYCQQFAGAMALMLRMVGVPARVATGFAPGTPLPDGHGYEVTDLDAHSWVEVYFNRIGWVRFDPTPATAFATDGARPAALGAPISLGEGGGREASKGAHNALVATAGDDDRSGPPLRALAIIAALLVALAAIAPLRSLRHRRLAPGLAVEREVGELRRVLRASGWAAEPATTLLAAEGRLRGARRSAAAAYVGRFRARLYSAEPGPRPSLAERRAARRDLATGTGLRGRLRVLIAMPPGAPGRPR